MRKKHGQSSTAGRRIGIGFMVCAALGLQGCQDSTGPRDSLPGLSIRTGAETIHFVPSGGANHITVPITLTNNSNKALNLSWCSESLERFSLRGWAMVYSPVCLANLQTLPEIPVGASLTFDFHAWDTPQQYPGYRFTDSPNFYRVRLGLWIVDILRSEPVPADASVTNAFAVEP